MKTLLTLITVLLAAPLALAQNTLAISNVYALYGNDTLRGDNTLLQLDAEGAPGNAYIMAGGKVAVRLDAKLSPAPHTAPAGTESTRMLSMDITMKADREKQTKHVDIGLTPNSNTAVMVTEPFTFSGGSGTQPVILSFNIALE
ncbi:MAG TPA: hypothetical protein PKD45_01130 [Flavobacteriales bacterium]|nr:hypothetical protein [Flavobacteriales bacterium]